MSTQPRLQRQMKASEFPISYLYDKRNIFDNYPEYQRKAVWERGRKQLLINSIFNGLPIPPLIAHKLVNGDGETIYELIDGKQRFTTICDFREGKFATATPSQMRRLEPLWEPIEPGKTYNELSVDAKHCFNDFNVLLYSSSDVDIAIGAQIYRNLQKGKRLTLAQNLKSYFSKVVQTAYPISNHAFWVEIYRGSTIGEERLRGALHVLLMETARDYVPQADRNMRDFCCGIRDHLVTDDLFTTCMVQLDIVLHLFSKAQIYQPYEVIPMYQAVTFLQKAGYNLDHLGKGCFFNWFAEVQTKAYRNRYQGGGSTFASLERLENQRYFWEEHLPVIKGIVERAHQMAV